MAGMPWTDQEVEVLRVMAQGGRSMRDIRNVLKSRSLAAINCKAADIELSLNQGVPEIDIDAFNAIMGETWKPRVAV